MIRYVDNEVGSSSLGCGLDSEMGYCHFVWAGGFYCTQICIQVLLFVFV